MTLGATIPLGNNREVADHREKKPQKVFPGGPEMGRRVSEKRKLLAKQDKERFGLRRLCEDLDLNESELSKLENGLKNPDTVNEQFLRKLGAALDLSPAFIRYGEAPEKFSAIPPATVGLRDWLVKFLNDQTLVDVVAQNPFKWAPRFVVEADGMANSEQWKHLTAEERLIVASEAPKAEVTTDDVGIVHPRPMPTEESRSGKHRRKK